MKVALYARVSTTLKGQDVNLQLCDLREYAQARKMEIYQEYVDIGVSGYKDTRPSLNLMMGDAKKRRFAAVIVWRFDRFGRSTKHLITSLEEFKNLGIAFISFQENIDTGSPMGKAMFGIIAAMAEFERDLIRERVLAGLANAKAKGVRMGRPPVEVDIEKVMELHKQGFSIRQIAKQTEITRSIVHKTILKNAVKTEQNQL